MCTLGPASMQAGTIRRLAQCGASLFRVNLSHTKVRDLRQIIATIRDATDVPICLDTEGAQVRTGNLINGSIELHDNTVVRVHHLPVPGDDWNFNLYPRDVAHELVPGDFLSIDFNSALVQVLDTDADGVRMRVLQGGLVGQNKGVSVEREVDIPSLTDKDREALEIGHALGIAHVALSFARRGADVRELRELAGQDAHVIAKIETIAGLHNLEDIAAEADALLIDRGDLSRQVAIEMLPQTQKRIIARARAMGRKVYVATNLLESMVSQPSPTRAEVNDIHTTLADGADGLVLAAETAIGRYPVRCALMVQKMVRVFERGDEELAVGQSPGQISLLTEPHGGRLVQRRATDDDRAGIDGLRTITVTDRDVMDCEQLAEGTYSPLTGFMDRETLGSVLADCRLPDGTVWTMPLLLAVDPRHATGPGAVRVGERVALVDADGVVRALLDVTERFTFDLPALTEAWFGTASPRHPGVERTMALGNHFLAGAVTLVEPLASTQRPYLLTPTQTRFIFDRMGWSRVIGFHTRNPAHRAHESIQLRALERTGADGIYISPVASPENPGDFLPEPVLLSYQTLMAFGRYPARKVVLGSLFTWSRYAGPREAVFTALCRKNMGCSHFIIGRDHTGVRDFYGPEANREMFDRLGDLGIAPEFFDTVGYNPATGAHETSRGQELSHISGTHVRSAFRRGERLPDWFMRSTVQDVLLAEVASGRPVFRD
nr:pyruvate kinase [Salsipaludibacter albus]